MEKVETREPVVLENEGQKIFGILHKPINIAKPPVVLFCHGLAGNKTGKFRIYVQLAEKLSKTGIASLRIDFRGSGDSEGQFRELTLASETSDALKALEFLQGHKDFNKERIGIFGRSVGGLIALKAATAFGQIKSIAVWAPLFDGNQWKELWNLIQTAPLTAKARHDIMSVNGQVPSDEFFKQLFMTSMDKEIESLNDIPFLHIHGEQDSIVEISHAAKYELHRKQSKAENHFVKLAKTDHDFSEPEERLAAMEMTCKWFTDTL